MQRTMLASLVAVLLTTAFAQGAPAASDLPKTASLTVAAQVGHDFALTLDSVAMPRRGYVVVYAYDARGRLLLNAPLGVLPLEAGSYDDVVVPMRLALLERRGYIDSARDLLVRLHEDDGDGRFFYRTPGSGDVPMVRSGVEISRRVSYRQGSVISAIDQTLTNGAMTVASAYVPKASFIVVTAAGFGAAPETAKVLGSTLVPAGQHRYVRIPLDPEVLADEGYGTEPRVVSLTVSPDNGDGVLSDAELRSGIAGGRDAPPALHPSIEMPAAGVPSLESDGNLRLELGAEGMSVRLTGVTLTQTTFVALHAVAADGSVIDSPVIARSGRRKAGTYRNLVIDIPDGQAPVIGDRVVVLFHLDDGDGSFRSPASDPPAEANGVVVAYPMTLR